MPALVFDSAEEMEAKRDFKLLPEDEYVLEVTAIEVQHGKTSQFNTTPHDELAVTVRAVSFSNGDALYFDDGSEPDPTKPVTLRDWLDTTKRGMLPQPSRTRKFLTSALGIPTGARIELDSYEDLIGKRLIGRVLHKTNGKGVTRDRLVDYRPVRTRPTRAKKATEEVEADAEALLAKARETFGDDLAEASFE